MRSEMSHDEAFAELDAVAFDLLDRPERDVVLAHVETCEICRPELDARRAMVADLALAAPAASEATTGGRARMRERLITRAQADAQSRRFVAPPILFPTPSMAAAAAAPEIGRSKWGRAEWMAIAAGILLVMTLGMLGVTMYDRSQLRTALIAQTNLRDGARHQFDSLATVVASRDSVIAGLTGRDVTVMTLTSAGAKEPYARMFWDRARNSWTFIAHNMPALRTGRTYQLWLVTTKSKISAGTFSTRNGEAVVIARAVLSDPLSAVAVTEEPEGGVPQPTGAIIVAAQNTAR
jgi:hypothetical protein